MQRFPQSVYGMGAAYNSSEFQFVVIHIHTNRPGTAGFGSSDGAKSYSATAENCDGIACGDSSACCGVKSHCQRFNQTQFFRCEFCGIQLVRRHHNKLSECAIPLHSESLVALARIRTPTSARCACTAAGVRRESYIHANRESGIAVGLHDCSRDFMARNAWIRNQWV